MDLKRSLVQFRNALTLEFVAEYDSNRRMPPTYLHLKLSPSAVSYSSRSLEHALWRDHSF